MLIFSVLVFMKVQDLFQNKYSLLDLGDNLACETDLDRY